jgi:uncharacterized protein (TIGR02466 family)
VSHESSGGAPAPASPSAAHDRFSVHPLFSTPVLLGPSGLTAAQQADTAEFLLALRTQDDGVTRSNRGGWHSSGNLFDVQAPLVDLVRGCVARALSRYVTEAFRFQGTMKMQLYGWANVQGPGSHFNQTHNHPGHWLSGVLYLRVPQRMQGGELVLLDPRFNLNALDAGQAPCRPPWFDPEVRVQPEAGGLVVFPAWLQHHVEPFESADDASLRISLAFNASPV